MNFRAVVHCPTCGIRTERVAFVEPKARITRRLRQLIGLDCQSMPTSHAAKHFVSWHKARLPLTRTDATSILRTAAGSENLEALGFNATKDVVIASVRLQPDRRDRC